MQVKNSQKIEGKAFDKIKEKVAAKKAAEAEATRIAKEAHDALWSAIHEEFPELDKEACLSLDVQYEKLGFYVVKDKSDSGLLAAIKASLKD